MPTPTPAERAQPDVYPLLKLRVQRGEFPPGHRLPSLRKLAMQYSTSVTNIHHAILRLEREGLVQVRHGSGVYAADLSTRAQRVLLLNPIEGDHWVDLTRAFTQTFGADPRVHLLIESPPFVQPGEINPALASKVKQMVADGLDVIVFNGMNDLGLEFLEDYAGPVPMVCFLLDEVVDNATTGRVLTDAYHGGYSGMRHLMEIGCRRVVLTQHSEPAFGPLHQFLLGARAAASESIAGVEVKSFVASVDDRMEDVLSRFSALQAEFKPDGVFAHADWVASRVLTDMRRRGVRVPEEVAVLGYYDTPWTMMTDPPMSSITTDPGAIVSEVKRLLETRRYSERVVVKPKLVIRESTRARQERVVPA